MNGGDIVENHRAQEQHTFGTGEDRQTHQDPRCEVSSPRPCAKEGGGGGGRHGQKQRGLHAVQSVQRQVPHHAGGGRRYAGCPAFSEDRQGQPVDRGYERQVEDDAGRQAYLYRVPA